MKEGNELPSEAIRTFDTGATRDRDEHKHNYRGFLSVYVIRAFGRYMHKHRLQKDGSYRAADNWQKGMSRQAYMESLFRHFMDVWELYETGAATIKDFDGNDVTLEDALCGMFFNVQGMLHELLKGSSANPFYGKTAAELYRRYVEGVAGRKHD